MPLDPDTIAQQRSLLAAQRRTLAHLVQQAAAHGGMTFAPPATANSITEARAAIQRIKALLRTHDVAVADEPNDDAPPQLELVTPPRTEGDQIGGDRVGGDKVGGDKVVIENQAPDQSAQGIFHGSVSITHNAPAPSAPGSAPPRPALVIGREGDLDRLKTRLGIGTDAITPPTLQVITAVRGWPGVGKTTLAAAVAHDPAIGAAFPDGVLWAALGKNPGIFAELAAWCRALGVPDLVGAKSVQELSAQLTALLRNKRMLLIVDDVWDARDAAPFNVGGHRCAILVTTRLPEVARTIAPTADDVYVLGVLSDENALILLRQLAPEVVAGAETAGLELVHALEGLPLAIQVAGRLLHAEASYGLDVTQLLADLREGVRLLSQDAPLDRVDPVTGVTPTVAILLRKSTERLDKHTLECFAYLGAFAPKPATFDADDMKSVWEADDPVPTIRTLVDRGLIEPTGNGHYWMHALLVAHAQSFLTS